MISEIPITANNRIAIVIPEARRPFQEMFIANPNLYAQKPIAAPKVFEMMSFTSKVPRKVKD
ncbi:hypothetical protein JCM16418A_17860 [Paenibacillus pini]